MRKFWSVTILSVVLGSSTFAKQATEQNSKPVAPEEKPAVAEPLHKDGFFTFATKMINPKNIDYGELIAERRNALANASATNSYFWYSAGSTTTVLVLLFVLYVKLLEYQDFRWRAAEVITDFRNSEKLATAKTRQAVASYKRHMVQCNRVVEAEIAGRVLPGGVIDQDMQLAMTSLRQELDASNEEKTRLKQQLQEKETFVRDMTKRMDAFEQTGPSMPLASANSPESTSELMMVINRMARELDAEKRRNAALKGA